MPVVVVTVDVHVSPSTHHALHETGISGRGKGELTGTQYWMAPEISTADGNPASSCEHNEKTDVWAFGLVRYGSLCRLMVTLFKRSRCHADDAFPLNRKKPYSRRPYL